MRKISQILTAAVFSVAFVGVGFLGTATMAQTLDSTQCDGSFTITVTGNGSNGTIDCKEDTVVSVTCTNNGAVVNYTDQQGTSGSANVTGNGSNGSSVTGGVTNSNSTTTDLNFSCPITNTSTSPSPTPTPSTTPTPGKGSVTPAALPNTASNSALTIVVGSLIAAAAIVVGSRIAVAAYRRISTK